MEKIDFVVPWVDSNDPEWIALYNHYRPEKPIKDNSRFRDWDIFRYWFRAVERYAPWVIYPYWLVKFYMLNGGMPLLFEHENAFCEPLNGPLWYLPAILFMHITIDLCRKTKHQHIIMISLCILSVILYAANKYYFFPPTLHQWESSDAYLIII